MIIAVTGGLGSGKSTVSRILATTLKTDLIDTDQLCREQLLPGAEGFEKFKHSFGDSFLQSDGTVDRQFLRQAVFADSGMRGRLEGILHPIVQRQVAARRRDCAGQGRFLVVEVPLLYEVGWQDEFDACVVVSLPEAACLQRVVVREKMAAEEVLPILRAQIPLAQKVARADFVVDNSGTFVSTVQQVAWLSRKLENQRKEQK